MNKKLFSLWVISTLVVGIICTAILVWTTISTAKSLEWPGALGIALLAPFLLIASVAYYFVGALIVFGIAMQKVRKNLLQSSFFLYVSKMNFLMFFMSLILAIAVQFAEIPVGTASVKTIVHIGPYDFINKPEVTYEISEFPSPFVGHMDVFARYNNGNLRSILKPLACSSSNPDIVKIEENTPGWNGCSVRFLKPGMTVITAEYEQLSYSKNVVITQKQ